MRAAIRAINETFNHEAKAELLLAAQRKSFELLIRGESLATALDALVKSIEELVDGLIGSVMLLDEEEKRLWTAASPHLPQAYVDAIDGVPIGPQAGSCGTSAFRKELVIVSDTYSDPLWADYGELARKQGLRTCWSSPILSQEGKVLGIFAMYFREVREPNAFELQLVQDATSAAALSIEYMRAKDALAKAFSLLNSTIESTADGILVVDLDGNIQSYNQRFIEMWGIPANIQRSRSYQEFVAFASERQKNSARYLSRVNELCSDPQMEGYEYLEFKDGRIFERYSIPQRLAEKIVGRVWSYRDVTEKKKTESDLRESEERFRALSESTFEAVLIHDRSKILLANRSASRLYGYASSELIGMDGLLLATPKYRDLVKSKLYSSEPYELRGLRKDGSEFWAEARGKSINFRGVPARVVAVRDITERKAAEEKLRQIIRSEKNEREKATFLAEAGKILAGSLDYELTLKNISKLIVSYFADWCFLALVKADEIIQAVAATAEPSRAELVRGLEGYCPDFDAPQGVPRAIRIRAPILYADVSDEQLQSTFTGWTIVGTNNPDYLKIIRELGLKSYMAVPMIVRDKAIGGMFIASANPGHRYSEEDLALAYELARNCAMAIDNAAMYQESQRSIEARDDFISIASHELRTPLTPLKIQVQFLKNAVQKNLDKLKPADLNELLSSSMAQIERMEKLVENLLDVSRIRSGRLLLSFENVDLSDLVSAVLKHLASQIEAAKCKVSFFTDSGSTGTGSSESGVRGYWDRARIEQVVTNLLTNAIKYGQNKPIEIRVTQTGATATLSVTDHGLGIAPKDQAKIFGRFERVASLRSFSGLGLGLYISRQIVEEHGGFITVASELGKGSTFTVSLPLMRQP